MQSNEAECILHRRQSGYPLTYRLASRDGRFSIEISCKREREVVWDVAPTYAEAVRLFEILYRSGVFPCHLKDVLEDLLSETE